MARFNSPEWKITSIQHPPLGISVLITDGVKCEVDYIYDINKKTKQPMWAYQWIKATFWHHLPDLPECICQGNCHEE